MLTLFVLSVAPAWNENHFVLGRGDNPYKKYQISYNFLIESRNVQITYC